MGNKTSYVKRQKKKSGTQQTRSDEMSSDLVAPASRWDNGHQVTAIPAAKAQRAEHMALECLTWSLPVPVQGKRIGVLTDTVWTCPHAPALALALLAR